MFLLDSGAFNQTCCIKDMFSTIRPYESVIKVSDGREQAVKGIGEVKLGKITNGKSTKIKIANTLYVSDIRVNLFQLENFPRKVLLFYLRKISVKSNLEETWLL